MIIYDTISSLVMAANQEKRRISDINLTQAALDEEKSEEEIFQKMKDSYLIMKEAARLGSAGGLKSVSGLTSEMGYKMRKSVSDNKNFSGKFFGNVIANALSISQLNASMGKIVAAPTAGSCGILPGCLIALQDELSLSDDEMVYGLLNAAAIGMVIAKNASVSGAECGCQAECGTAAAMAASAMTEIMGGTPQMCSDAVACALKNLMGLICDPVAGLVEEPCIIRNPGAAAIAVVAAEISLSGISAIIPADETIETMNIVGRNLPSGFRETAEGGIAVTATGKSIEKELRG